VEAGGRKTRYAEHREGRMTLEVWFWIIYVIALLFNLWSEYVPG
jgi:hypothetical protein